MDARSWAWILFIPLAVAGSIVRALAMDQALLVLPAFAIFNAVLFLMGFAFSPDTRPPKIPPRTRTARTVVIPLGLMGLSAAAAVLLGHRALSYYVAPDYLVAVVYVASLWLLGAFAARWYDSHQPPKPEASYDIVLMEYHKAEKEPENPA